MTGQQSKIRIKVMNFFQEALLEPVARKLRFLKGIKYLDRKDCVVVDLGCGPKLRFLKFALSNNIKIKKYIGVDPLVNHKILNLFKSHKNIKILDSSLIKKIDILSDSADYVVAFAFFEHIDHPKEILDECLRILKPSGKIILTVPSKKAQIVLEFLSFKLGLISSREIEEHKQYFDKESLLNLFPKNKHCAVKHEYFELGLNNLFVITKKN